jgi:hypothetical protein
MQKKFLLLAVLFMGVVISTTAFAIDPMGPPAATIDKGGWGIGINYSYTDADMSRRMTSWSDGSEDVDIEMHRTFADLLFGASDNVTLFVGAGAGSMEWDKISGRKYAWEGDDGDWDLIWRAGVKATLSESDNVSWGFVGSYSSGKLSGSQKESGGDHGGYEITTNEFQFAIGPTVRVSDSVSIYGGPFIDIVSGTWSDNIWGYRNRKTYESQDYWGGYLGTAIEISKNSCFNVEGMLTREGWAVGAGVMWRCK